MFQTNPKTRKIVWGVVIAALVIGVGIWALQKNKSDEGTGNSTPTVNNTDETPIPTGAGSKKLTYAEALKIYGAGGNNYRFQFSTNCLATPGRIAMATGTKFMLDNLDTVAHKFVIGKQTFNVSKNGFVIVTAAEKGTLSLVCDGNKRAEVVVQ